MDRAESYRKRAEHAERSAELAADEELRRKYLELAAKWRELADRASGSQSPK